MRDTCFQNRTQKETCISGLFTSALFEEILNKGMDIRVRVTGRSMAPFLKSGNIVTITSVDPNTLIKGDIVFYKNNQGLPVMHRLICFDRSDKGNTWLLTKGDALKTFDEPVYPQQVLGKIIKIEKNTRLSLNLESYGMRSISHAVTLMHLVKSEVMNVLKFFKERKIANMRINHF